MIRVFLIIALSASLSLSAQEHYRPHRSNFVCENGENRYTRALYGSHTDWRLETSDRPVFAVVKKGHHRNIRFVFEKDGVSYPLDSTDYCRATYANGRREYLLKDQRWGEGVLRIEVLALSDREAAVWRIASPQLQGQLRVMVCQIAQPKLYRNGDIGVDQSNCLEAAGEPLQNLRDRHFIWALSSMKYECWNLNWVEMIINRRVNTSDSWQTEFSLRPPIPI